MKEDFINLMKKIDMDEFNLIRYSELGEKLSYINILHLYIISHTEKITVSELAKKLNMSKPAITQKINDLEKLGMIKKTRCEIDKRVIYISLSDEIVKLLKKSKMSTVLDEVDKQFSTEKKLIFQEILQFINQYLGEDYDK